MKCHMVRERLSEYLDGELNEAEVALLASHLESCALCRREAEHLRGVDRALRALVQEERAPEMIPDLRQRLTSRRPGSPRWVWAGAAGVAVLLVWASMVIWGGSRPRPVPVTPPGAGGPAPQQIVRSGPKLMPPSEVVQAQSGGERRGEGAKVVKLSRRGSAQHAVERERPSEHEPPAPTPSEDLSEAAGRGLPALQPQPAPAQLAEAPAGIILILGEPEPVLPSSRCFIEVTRADGSRSSVNQVIERDAAGRTSAVDVSYQESGPEYQAPSQGG